jgi:N-formylglutamate deformylase
VVDPVAMSFSREPGVGAQRPLIVEVPHAGLVIPETFGFDADIDPRADADLYVDALCEDAPAYGATKLVAHLSRWVVDLNRGDDDIDPALFDPSRAVSASPRGAVWRVTMSGRPLVRRRCAPSEINARLDAFHRPYHAALDAEVERLRLEHGYVIVLAAHSMPSAVRRTRGDARPKRADVVPGTRGRTTASPRVIDAIDRVLRAEGLSVMHDDPYRGGHTTSRLGDPARGVHVVQLELNRALYMDERTFEIHEAGFRSVRAMLGRLFTELAEIVP